MVGIEEVRPGMLERALKGLVSSFSSQRDWELPDVSLLPEPDDKETQKEVDYQSPIDPDHLVSVLRGYGIDCEFSDYRIGSAVTTFEVSVPVGTRFSLITRFRDDIARDLGTPSLRIIKSVRNSSLIGFEVENTNRYTVHFKEIFEDLQDKQLTLPVIFGEDTYGQPIIRDLTEMPHLLVAGQTGSGKSVFLNTLILTLLCLRKPRDLRLLIVDPKEVEFAGYEHVPHMLGTRKGSAKIASTPEEARKTLQIAVDEMESRFRKMHDKRVKKISDYNRKVPEPERLPYILFIVDEFADLMMMGSRDEKKNVENSIVRLAQKARAVGIHMVLATQKPLAQIMTSLIKANMPARVCFSVSSGIDSRVVLDEKGAEALAGKGDMLFRDPTARSEYERISRIQAPWIPDEDIEQLLDQERK